MKSFAILSSTLFILFAFSSCRSIKTEAPKSTQIEAPTAIPQRNELVIPIEMDVTSYLKQAKEQVPPSYLGSDKRCEGVAYDLYFERTGVKMTANKDQIETTVDGKYWIKLSYCPTCTDMFYNTSTCISPRIPFSCGIGEPMPKIKLTLNTDLKVGSDYRLKTNTKLTQLKSLSPCQVTVFKYDITQTLMDEMHKALDKEMTNIDKGLGKVSFENTFKDVWVGLQQPIAIPGIGYLHFMPTSLKLTPINLDQNKILTTLVVTTNSLVNTQKDTPINPNLPSLESIKKLPHDTFELHTDFNLNYDSLSTLLKPSIVGKRIDVKKKFIVLDNMTFSCLNNSELLIKIDFSGSKKGTIYLTGNPVIDSLNQFTIQNLDYELKTKSVLLKSASWMFNDKILNELKKASTLSLDPIIAELKKQINQQLDFKIADFQVKGKAHDLNIEHLFPATEGLFLRTLFRGTIRVKN